jgi:protein-S-isoprenylcysteine O-methyltransferase Ste14
METLPPQEHKDDSLRAGMVHFILSHSYIVFLLAVVFGAIAHTFITIHVFDGLVFSYLGLFMLLVGPAIIYWAQHTSSCSAREIIENKTEQAFEHGPYKYSRNPTHIGLTIMTLGLGFVFNSFFTVIFILAAFLITKLFFLKEEEAILEKRYGEIYCQYKSKVHTWI